MSARPAAEKCWNHHEREAVARCPRCGHPFCRECVVEHDDRVICAGCLARLTSAVPKAQRQWSFRPIGRVVGTVFGLLVAWFVFFSVGRMLLSIPDRYHADTLWNKAFSDSMRGDDE